MRTRGQVTALALAIATAACGQSYSSALHPAGAQAARINTLTWTYTAIGAAVFVAVMTMLVVAIRRGRQRTEVAEGPEANRAITRWVVGSLVVTVVILMGVLVANFATGRALGTYTDRDALTIRVTARQWWWDVEYLDPRAHRRLATANEIHVPVGRRVRLEVESRDVIHSFWAPNLHGKIDMIPGYRGTTYFQVDEEGVYEGRCAEFCGHQHAKMQFRVIAESPRKFEEWYEAQLEPAVPPRDSARAAGQQVFMQRGCVLCHSIRGTAAGSRLGPDLTHLASRHTLAAGTIPNTRGHLAGWVVDPQRIKPYVQMPPNALSGGELQVLLDYLEALK